MVSAKKVITKKVYVGGLSMGGIGTLKSFGGNPAFLRLLFQFVVAVTLQKWVFMEKEFPNMDIPREKDPVVTPANSRRMVTALQLSKAKVKYNEYPGVQHDSWKNAFAEPDLLKWLFQQKRK